jgi:hypothetical protein
MDSFKVYLPSNASFDLFPDNTATDYRTRFDKPIELNGNWEVGVESISYSSQLRDEKEKGRILFHTMASVTTPVNNLYPFRFHTTEKGEWKGLTGVMPKTFEKDCKKLEKIIPILNALNDEIVDKRKGSPIFQFILNHEKRVEYCAYDQNFTLRLTATMANILGFPYQTVFTGSKCVGSWDAVLVERDLQQDDYMLRYMHEVCQQKEGRIIIKAQGETFDGKETTFLSMWTKKVTPTVQVTAEFKKGKFILLNYHLDKAMVFSKDFNKTFRHFQPLVGQQHQWSAATVNFDSNSDYKNEFWFVDTYGIKLDTTEEEKYDHNLFLTVFPWQRKTIRHAIHHINTEAKNILQERWKEAYDVKKHYFHLTLEENDHCKLTIGSGIHVWFTNNLSYMFSLPHWTIVRSETFGTREVDSLKNHSRQLHLLSSVIQPTAYGQQQRHILCDFLHRASGDNITEKHFTPISYHPVSTNVIDMIHIQLTDELYNPIKITDSKTIVTLYFRKI